MTGDQLPKHQFPKYQFPNYQSTIYQLALILLTAAVLRLAEIARLPVGLHYDETANYILTRSIAYGGYRPVFIGAYTGKEVLFFLWLEGPQRIPLYEDAPVYGRLPFPMWRAGMTVEDRLTVRLPRQVPPGDYQVYLAVGPAGPVRLGTLSVALLERSCAVPPLPHHLEADFGGEIRLLGYEMGEARAGQPFSLTLYWQALREMEEDYTVFVHLLDPPERRHPDPGGRDAPAGGPIRPLCGWRTRSCRMSTSCSCRPFRRGRTSCGWGCTYRRRAGGFPLATGRFFC